MVAEKRTRPLTIAVQSDAFSNGDQDAHPAAPVQGWLMRHGWPGWATTLVVDHHDQRHEPGPISHAVAWTPATTTTVAVAPSAMKTREKPNMKSSELITVDLSARDRISSLVRS